MMASSVEGSCLGAFLTGAAAAATGATTAVVVTMCHCSFDSEATNLELLSLNGDEKFESRARPDAAIRRCASHHSGPECRSHSELLRRNNSVPQGRSIR